MPIVIRNANGRSCPQVLCDHCGEAIATAQDGNYQWRWGSGSDPAPVFFTHKRCCLAFEAADTDGEGQWLWAAMDLQVFPVYLSRILRIEDWEAAETSADLLGALLG